VLAHTTYGTVSGVERDGVWTFRGIPFAAPPVGPLRFRAPAPPEPWSGERDGSRFAPMAPQGVGGLEAMLGAGRFAQSEDCLYLNVATPGADGEARPVMVWIHGGGFQTGAGSVPWYHGTRLAERFGVVVVSINYRLGVLGFSHLDGLGEAYAGSGNAGILDQIAALRWVQENIAAFGGDPGNVTIFGESAGGMSVGTLLGTPAARGLFHRAVAQSGAAQAVASPERAAEVAERVAARFGGLKGLLDAPIDDLLAAQAEVSAATRFAPGGDGLLPFQPVVDGVVLPRQPLAAIAGGSAAEVDLVAGTNAHEFTLFTLAFPPEAMTHERIVRNVARIVGDEERAEQVVAGYRALEPGVSDADLLVTISTDLVFRFPCEELLAAHAGASTGASTRSYLFTFESPAFEGRLRSTHALEIPFVFGVVDRPGNELFIGPIDDEVRSLSDACAGAWTSFAATGTPAGDGLPAWPVWNASTRETMELGPERRVVADPAAANRVLWVSAD
jgi:para-nitrobenzyl esterase